MSKVSHYSNFHCEKKVRIRRSEFSRIPTGYGAEKYELENTDQKKSEYGRFSSNVSIFEICAFFISEMFVYKNAETKAFVLKQAT